MKTHIFSVLCRNEPGVMMRVSSAFTRRLVNMDSITVGIEPSGDARMIILFEANDEMADFLRRILSRFTQVTEVSPLGKESSIAREIALIKTKSLDDDERGRVLSLVEEIGGRVLEVWKNSVIAEIHGDHERIEQALKSIGPDSLKEVARSGQVYISREFG